jgi:hypothetical protein
MDSFVSSLLHQDDEDRMTHRAFKFGWLRVSRTTIDDTQNNTPCQMGQLERKKLHNGSGIFKNIV